MSATTSETAALPARRSGQGKLARRHRRRAARPRPRSNLAEGLGLLGIALGAVQLLAPHAVARPLGLGGRERLVAGFGVRSMVTGLGLLAARDRSPWLMGRGGGDALDLTALAGGLAAGSPGQRGRAGGAFLAMAGVALLDLACLGSARRARAAGRYDYLGRRGFPLPANDMRGAANDFAVPRDFRIPEPLRPWPDRRG